MDSGKFVEKLDLESGSFFSRKQWDFVENYCIAKYCPEDRKYTKSSGTLEHPLLRSTSKLKGRHALASRNINSGETLLRTKGIVVVNHKYVDQVCGCCFEAFNNRNSGMMCEDCGEIWFCEECKTNGIKHNKILCSALSTLSQVIHKLPFTLDHDVSRLALHVLVQSHKLSFPFDLISHRTSIDDEQCKTALAGGAVLLKLLNMKNISETSAAELLLQIRFNAHSSNSMNEGRGGLTKPNALLGLFPEAATLNHSCRPNTTPVWRVRKNQILENDGENTVMLELKSVCSIERGSEVTFSYLSDQLLQGVTTRREFLSNAFLFKCDCCRCRNEEMLLTNQDSISKSRNTELLQARECVSQAMQQLTMKSANSSPPKLNAECLSKLVRIVSNEQYISTDVHLEGELFSDACGCVMLSKDSSALIITARALNQRWLHLGFHLSLHRAELLLMSVLYLQKGKAVTEKGQLDIMEMILEAYSIYSLILGEDHVSTRSTWEMAVATTQHPPLSP